MESKVLLGNQKRILAFGFILIAISVALGAAAEHVLRTKLDEKSMSQFIKANEYLRLHSIGFVLLSFYSQIFQQNTKSLFRLFLIGIILFSGSLFLLAFHSILNVNPIWIRKFTPFGGLILIFTWIYWSILAFRMK
jgi:uncharacterized membrane protein YgdD (TMEM256/DUF423 family)